MMLGDMRVNRSCAALQRRPAAMGSTMAARFIVPSRAIFPITAKCSTALAVTLGLGLTPSTADNCPVPTKFLSTSLPVYTAITGHLQNRSAARQGRTPANAAACCCKPGSDPTLLRPRSRLPEVRKFWRVGLTGSGAQQVSPHRVHFDQLPIAAQTLAQVGQPVACSSRLVGTSAKTIRVIVLT